MLWYQACGLTDCVASIAQGSIAFGSFIVAILDLLRAGLRLLQQYERDQGDAIGAAIACCAQCCVGCIASLVEYFNRYAYIECAPFSIPRATATNVPFGYRIALYGKPYIKAAKDTWNLFKDRGIDALVNDCLINNIWQVYHPERQCSISMLIPCAAPSQDFRLLRCRRALLRLLVPVPQDRGSSLRSAESRRQSCRHALCESQH